MSERNEVVLALGGRMTGTVILRSERADALPRDQ